MAKCVPKWTVVTMATSDHRARVSLSPPGGSGTRRGAAGGTGPDRNRTRKRLGWGRLGSAGSVVRPVGLDRTGESTRSSASAIYFPGWQWQLPSLSSSLDTGYSVTVGVCGISLGVP